MKIVMIGSGRVAAFFAHALSKKKGFTIAQVVGHSGKSSLLLARKVKAQHTTSFDSIVEDADLYVIAVKDDAIASVIRRLRFRARHIVHTSGTTGIDVFKGLQENAGVIYPLYSITGTEGEKKIPVCVEARHPATMAVIRKACAVLASKTYDVTSEQRKKIHLAAVFINNFTNHLHTLTNDYLKKNSISYRMFEALIEETAANVIHSPGLHQTGPARRGDRKIMKRHLELLENEDDMKKIYRVMSKSIFNLYHE